MRPKPNHHRYLALVRSTPAVVRAADGSGTPNSIVESSLGALVDAWVRRTLVSENYAEAIEDRDPEKDPHVAWLAGLLGGQHSVRQPAAGSKREPGRRHRAARRKP